MKKASKIMFGVIGVLALSFVVLLVMRISNASALEVVKQNLAATVPMAEGEVAGNSDGLKALGAGIVVGLAALGGAIAMGMAVAKSNEGISRQPEAEGKIRTSMMLGLVFIETVVIYALIVAILIIFVL